MEVRLLGPLEVIDDDGMPLPVPGGRQRALLSLLALRPGACVPAERLIDDLWGDRPPQQPAGALQVVVFKLRRIIGADRVTTQPSGYTLEIPTLAVDAHRFEHLARAARDALSAGRAEAAVSHLDDALALWRDTPLSDVRDAPTAASAAVRWETLRTTAHEDRFEALLATGRDAELIADIEAAIAGAPYSERLRAHQMIALYRSGRQADALRAFAETRRVLADDLGIEPGAELRRLELAILNQDPGLDRPSADAGAPPLVVAPTPAKPRRSNLRKPMTAFFGRARDLDGVTDLLSTQRLVTLVGAGGAGKTRLAIEIADRQGGRHPDGVWFVALDRLATGGDVAAAVASGLGLSTADAAGQRDLGATTLLDRLSDAVSERELLVVLDNCEHVIDAAAHVAVELLAAAPGLRVLATSREALRVPGEVVWAVPPLELPDAMQLFVDRAQATVSNAPVEVDPTVAELCRRLDGMPLAIELTAARTNAFTLTQLVERLDDRFRLLTGGARTSLPRQQTLRAVTDWSYDLLFDDERMVFERLSVFSGSCTLEAAEAVCADDDLPVTEIGPIIGRLVDKSLLVGDGNG
ncbi:MAG: winged helix-turn-helix domain-containing protein, partial [Actinobacteria bacterium]|nr:winged helix-turn-helix domain-containing protein [Actinomycetota bacterium]